ncbi:unnamed protein product [Calypogeia fissa]
MVSSLTFHVVLLAFAWGVVTFYFLSEEVNAESIQPTRIKVVIDGSKCIATVGDEFICATLDWWPPSKCDYGSCPWHNASILSLDLENPILEQAVKALAPLKIRLGGSLQDQIEYKIGSCPPLVKNTSDQFGFSAGCLSVQRWDLLNHFFKKTGASVAFGLNALYGMSLNISWDPSNAAEFIFYTHSHGYPVTAWELGNELFGRNSPGATVSPKVYAHNVKMLHTIVDRIYKNDATKPLVIAPDSFYEVGDLAYQTFLEELGSNVVDVVTWHIYNLGPGSTNATRLVESILNHHANDGEETNYVGLQNLLGQYPWASAWVGEAGGAYNSGHGNVTDAFIFAFWYLDQLGLASKHNTQAFCRQSLIGGHYGLLDATSFVPNPDFYGALLWKMLMGNNVLSVYANSTDLRAYAHCQKTSTKGGVTVLLLNYSNMTSFSIDLSVLGQSNKSGAPLVKQRVVGQQKSRASLESRDPLPQLEYHMSPEGGNILNRVVCLNGNPLRPTNLGDLPNLGDQAIIGSAPIILKPLTYAFVVLQNCSAVACISS